LDVLMDVEKILIVDDEEEFPRHSAADRTWPPKIIRNT
jgi:hypothetical protein